jgi:hypothetical protein
LIEIQEIQEILESKFNKDSQFSKHSRFAIRKLKCCLHKTETISVHCQRNIRHFRSNM